MKNRAGELKTNLSGELQYQSFIPAPLPPDPPIVLDDETVDILAQTSRHIGILEGLSSQIPNIGLFLSMYVRKEALLSSQIEGTQATLDDILDPGIEENTNRNVAEVINYIQAFQYALSRMKELPLCNRLLQETHGILIQDTRGNEKSPGEFRRSQNWIGPAGSILKDARYIPPSPDDMNQAMSDLEKYINNDDPLDPLIKIALIHYQFETIHPFLDGNGRIGRLLIVLFLMEKKLLGREALYPSYFLKKNRIEYYDRLMEVRNKGNFEQWVKFFLLAIDDAAQDAITTIGELVNLHTQNEDLISMAGKPAKPVKQLFNYLESSPIIDIMKTSKSLKLSYNTVAKAVDRLIELGILKQTINIRRNRLFAYEAYLAILRRGT